MKVSKKTNIVIIILNISLVLLAILLFDAHYEKNDDFTMASIASGMYGFSSPRIVFSNIVYGYLLKLLYNIVPAINWIVFVYYLMLVLVGVLIAHIVLETKKQSALYSYVILMLIFYREIYCVVNFTRIAIWVSALSYVVLIYCLSKEEYFSKLKCILAGVGLVYASMLRFEAFMEVSAFAFVAWIIQLLFKNYISVSKIIIPYVVIFSVIVLLLLADKFAYRDKQWQDYEEWNYERAMLLDYTIPDYIRYQNEYKQLGITYAQYCSLEEWCYEDPDVYDADFFYNVRHIGPQNKHSIVKTVHKVIDIIFGHYYLWCSLLFGAAVVFLHRNKWMLASFVVYGFVAFAEIVYLFIKGRYVDRVLVGVGIGFCVFLFINSLISDEMNATNGNIKIKNYLALISVIVTVLITRTNYSLGNSFMQGDMDVLDYLEEENQENILVMEPFANEYIMQAHGMMRAPRKDLLCNSLALGGWYSQAPIMLEHQARLGIDNIYLNLLEDNVLYLSCDSEKICGDYLTEKMGHKVAYDMYYDLGEISLYKYRVEAE